MFKELFTKSNGTLRGLGCILMIVGELGKSIPEIAPYADILTQVGMAIGGTGIVKATLVKK